MPSTLKMVVGILVCGEVLAQTWKECCKGDVVLHSSKMSVDQFCNGKKEPSCKDFPGCEEKCYAEKCQQSAAEALKDADVDGVCKTAEKCLRSCASNCWTSCQKVEGDCFLTYCDEEEEACKVAKDAKKAAETAAKECKDECSNRNIRDASLVGGYKGVCKVCKAFDCECTGCLTNVGDALMKNKDFKKEVEDTFPKKEKGGKLGKRIKTRAVPGAALIEEPNIRIVVNESPDESGSAPLCISLSLVVAPTLAAWAMVVQA